jgi:hypothetical protein
MSSIKLLFMQTDPGGEQVDYLSHFKRRLRLAQPRFFYALPRLPNPNYNLHRDIDHKVISNLQSLAITNLRRLALRRYFLEKLHAHQCTAPNQTFFCGAATVSEATAADAISFHGQASTSVASCALTAELRSA